MACRRHLTNLARKWIRRRLTGFVLLMGAIILCIGQYPNIWKSQRPPEVYPVGMGDASVRRMVVENTGEMKKNVFYLAIHQAGSATMSVLLYRFARHHGLSVLPVNRTPHTSRLSDVLMHPPEGVTARHRYNVFAEQYVYREDDVMALMTSGAVHVATIRSPLSQMRAILAEVNSNTHFRRPPHDPALDHLQNTSHWGDNRDVPTRNVQIRELGLGESQTNNQTLVDRYIRYIHNRFDLVLVYEYFDESLVLAKRRFNWQMEDVMYVGLDAGNVTRDAEDEMFGPVQEAHVRFSPADYVLHDHFVGTLLSAIRDEIGFSNELSRYRHIKKQVWSFCQDVFANLRISPIPRLYETADSSWSLQLDPRPWSRPFTVHALECVLMRTHPVVLRNCLKITQYPQLCTSPTIERIYDKSSILTDISWLPDQSNTLHINPIYCTPLHPVHNIPIAVLTFPGAFTEPSD